MYVFWWTGKGYLVPVTLIGVLALFGLILQAGQPQIPDVPWFWGLAAIAASVLNWLMGCRINARKRTAIKSSHLKDQLLYPARHKFMCFPNETWSVAFAIIGMAAILYDLAS